MKRIFVIATGGTIAGVGEAGSSRYRSGELSVSALLEAVPGLGELAQVGAHQLANIGSQDMGEALWFELATLVARKLQSADCDGVVIIHGTDTMEETAFFLHCVLPQSAKPVVLTGAMRPATATAPDGPRNLLAAVAVAASEASAERGVLVVFADRIFSAASVAKTHTQHLDAFSGGSCGVLGRVAWAGDGSAVRVVYDAAVGAAVGEPVPLAVNARPEAVPATGLPASLPHPQAALPRVDLAALAAQGGLPKVALVTAHVGQMPEQIDALVRLGCRGIVVAGLGNGNFSAGLLCALKTARARGVLIVRATRVPFGGVTPGGEVDDAAHDFVCAGSLTPPQARILLALALANESADAGLVRDWFASFGPGNLNASPRPQV